MKLNFINHSGLYPVTVNEIKNRLRIETNDDDELIVSCIRNAVSYAEKYTSRYVMPQEWRMYFDTFNNISTIDIEDVQSLTINYKNSLGVDSVFDSNKYYTDLKSYAVRILLKSTETFPEISEGFNSVWIDFNLGTSHLPLVFDTFRDAITQLACSSYENGLDARVPYNVDALLNTVKFYEIVF